MHLPSAIARSGRAAHFAAAAPLINAHVVPRPPARMLHSAVPCLHNNPLGLPTNTDSKFKPNPERMRQGLPQKRPIAGVKHVVAVSSGKGGVGKSTTAVNLAVALSQRNKSVGILDADLYGPSIPRLMNLRNTEPMLDEHNRLLPLSNYGVQCMSMGFLVREEDPVVWRGMMGRHNFLDFMIMKALEQLLRQVNWGSLDVLVIDMPPGTGDTQLTLTQQIPISGAVIVSTPQDIALIDVVKGVNMFKKVQVPLLGLVENMSHFVCSNCNHTSHIFGSSDKLQAKAAALDMQVIGRIPLTEQLCEMSDAGKPVTVLAKDGPESRAYFELADRVLAGLGKP
ncbi:P-loop containing nucleoside triphosphate hydrolase protein [Catenaria anguillulae PL171]|uniref:Nucleotide-binding protein-like n=1 Tax=Catenaria anguillulae PL171 TaxID=765915 RepID=A0A1Y2I614_9FUNG|nr:P-loop containing nucleoside triphosphate hydrolase protein [Catenaria anguillulae PL171]